MKILKIFGLVVGVHLVALIMIFANPGCTATTKPPPSPADTAVKTDPAPLSVPMSTPAASTPPSYAPPSAAPSVAPASFDPNAPAVAPSGGVGVRFTPTRPNTPAASTLISEPVQDVTPATTYTVKSGDTLWDLQKKFGIPYATIAAANNLKTNATLHAGQKLVIPQKMPSTGSASNAGTGANRGGATVAPGQTGPGATAPATAAAPAPAPAGKEVMKHIVQPGETLGAIARRYGVRSTDIAVANHITDPAKVREGKELIIPGWEPKGQKQGSTKSGNDTKKSAAGTNAEATQPPASETPILRLDQATPPPSNPFSPAPRN